jgi:hypothetical protein
MDTKLEEICESTSAKTWGEQALQILEDGRVLRSRFRRVWGCIGCNYVGSYTEIVKHLRANVRRASASPRRSDTSS